MLELCSIASGSSGNCICVGSDNHHVLIDAGISGKRIENGLNEVDLKSQDMDGILVTHEHLDHIAGLGVMARRYGLPQEPLKPLRTRRLWERSTRNYFMKLFRRKIL